MLICPVCKKQLSKSGGSYVCPEKHSFDISRRGYVNLLQSQSPKNHGDDKQMAAARREFLNGGFYSRLRECICSNIKGSCVADICCGEGYYLEGICQKLSACSSDGSTYGIGYIQSGSGRGMQAQLCRADKPCSSKLHRASYFR